MEVKLWKQVEKDAIENGVDPLSEKFVHVKKIRMTWEEGVATLSNPEATKKEMEECIHKLNKCLDCEKAILDNGREIINNTMADEV